MEIFGEIWLLMQENISFEGEGGECSLIARFLIYAIVLEPFPESGDEWTSIWEGKSLRTLVYPRARRCWGRDVSFGRSRNDRKPAR
jgi:hypothetical protein